MTAFDDELVGSVILLCAKGVCCDHGLSLLVDFQDGCPDCLEEYGQHS